MILLKLVETVEVISVDETEKSQKVPLKTSAAQNPPSHAAKQQDIKAETKLKNIYADSGYLPTPRSVANPVLRKTVESRKYENLRPASRESSAHERAKDQL